MALHRFGGRTIKGLLLLLSPLWIAKAVALLPLLAGGMAYAVVGQIPDTAAGVAGWTSFGLAGVILGWLCLVHLPAKDKQLKELLDSKDRQVSQLLQDKDAQLNTALEHKWKAIETISNNHRDEIKLLAAEFRAVVVETSQHCDKEVERMVQLVESRQRRVDELTHQEFERLNANPRSPKP